MEDGRPTTRRDTARGPGLLTRVGAGWRELFGEQRLAALSALALIFTMFLPWYTQTPVGIGGHERTLIAFQSWGFVEASILLVALAVLALVGARAERRAFHLPFGDGVVIMAAGAWVMFLVFYRQVDHPSGGPNVAVGVSWGIFLAFLCGAVMAYAGWRIHAQRRPEPLVDGDDPRTARLEGDPASVAGGPDLRAHDTRPTTRLDPDDAPTRPIPPDERPTRVAGTTAAARGRRRRRDGDGQFEGQMSFDDPDAPRPEGD